MIKSRFMQLLRILLILQLKLHMTKTSIYIEQPYKW